MATVAEIERLAALVQRLVPLSSRERGELIAAEHWNTVVGALVEVARAVVTSGGVDDEVGPHEHPDQVRTSWLEPRLRSLVERGPLVDPVAENRLGTLERRIAGIDGRVAALDDDLDGTRAIVTRVATSDLTREAAITRLSRKTESVTDPGEEVRSLRETLGAIRADVDLVTELASGLTVGGRPVSLASVVERLSAVEELRDRLTTPSGELLDAGSIERRLTELSTSLVTESELDEALAQVRTKVPDDLRVSIREEAVAAGREAALGAAETTATDLNNQIAERLTEARAEATSAAADAVETFGSDLRKTLRAELASTVEAGDTAVRSSVDEALRVAVLGVRGEIDEQLAALDRSANAALDARLDEALPGIRKELTEQVDRLVRALEPLSGRLDGLAADVGANRTAIETVRLGAADGVKALGTVLRRELDADLADLADRVAADRSKLAETLRAEVAGERLRVDAALEDFRRRVPSLVEEGVRGARQDLIDAVRREVDNLRPQLEKQLDERFDQEIKRRDRIQPEPTRIEPTNPSLEPTNPRVRPEPIEPRVRPEPVNPGVRPEPVGPRVRPEPLNPAVRPTGGQAPGEPEEAPGEPEDAPEEPAEPAKARADRPDLAPPQPGQPKKRTRRAKPGKGT